MGSWTEEMKRAASDRMRTSQAAMSKEEKDERQRKRLETMARNRVDKPRGKVGRPKKDSVETDLEALAQQMGFASAKAALIDAAVEEAALWAVKNKQIPGAPVLVATVGQANQLSALGKWDDAE